MKLAKNRAKQCVIAIVGRKAKGQYRFKRGFYGLADVPVVFQEKLDWNSRNEIPAWQDDMIVVHHCEEVIEFLKILQKKRQ